MSWQDWCWSWLARSALQGTVVLAVGYLIVRRTEQPARRLRLTQFALVACVLVSCLGQVSGLPHWSLGLLAGHDGGQAQQSATVARAELPRTPPVNQTGRPSLTIDATSDAVETRAHPRADTTSTRAAHASVVSWHRVVPGLVVLLYAAAVLALLTRWLLGATRLWRLARRARPVPDAVDRLFASIAGERGRRVRLLANGQTELPIMFGIWRPVILLPEGWCRGGEAAALRYALAHEWSHVERRDLAWWQLTMLVQCLFFYQPLVWWLRRQLRLYQDLVADRRAARQAPVSEDYAEFLVRLARGRAKASLVALGVADNRSNLYRRVTMLLETRNTISFSCGRRWSCASGVAALALVAAVSTMRLEADDKAAAPPNSANQASQADANRPASEASVIYTGHVKEFGTDAPIAGATVTVCRSIRKRKDNHALEETTHQTDAEGKYSFAVLAEQAAERNLSFELEVEHPRYAPLTSFGRGRRSISDDIVLRPGEEVRGVVVLPDGKPAVGCRVQAYSKAEGGGLNEPSAFVRAVTDEEGRFHVMTHKTGNAVLWLLPDDLAPAAHAIKHQRGDVGRFVLRPGISLGGRVLDVRGQPLTGIWVEAKHEGTDAEKSLPVSSAVARYAQTNDLGEFSLAPLPPGDYQVKPAEHGDLSGTNERKVNPLPAVFLPEKIALKDGQVAAPLEIRALPHVVIEVQCVDTRNRPHGSGDCNLTGRFDGKWDFWMCEAADSGKFSVKAPHGLEDATLYLTPDDHGVLRHRLSRDGKLSNSRELKLGTLNDDQTTIEIVRYEEPVMVAKVVAEDGGELGNVQVSISLPEGRGQFFPGQVILEDGGLSDVMVEKQADGRFQSVQLLPDEDATVTAKADGYQPASQTVRLAEGARRELTFALRKQQ